MLKDDRELGEKCGLYCVCIVPVAVMVAYFIKALSMEFYTTWQGWLLTIGILIAIPIVYAITYILPMIFYITGTFIGGQLEKGGNNLNSVALFFICLIADAIVVLILYYIHTLFPVGDDDAEPLHIRYDGGY